MKYITTIDEKEFAVDIVDDHHVVIDDKVFEVDFESVSGQPVYSLLINGQSHEAYVYAAGDEWQVLLLGRQYAVKVENEREKRLRSSSAGGKKVQETGEFQLKAPMPGLVVAVSVSEGQLVEKGQVLVILESMKMQNELKSPHAGKVERIKVKAGETVEQRQLLLSVI